MPASLFVRTEVKKRERRRKGENSFVPGCIFLRLWFPSTANVNKQSHERGKHGQSGGGKKMEEAEEEEVGNSRRAKNILAGRVRYKSPAHLLVSLPDKNTHTLRQHKYGWRTHQLTEEPLWVLWQTLDTLQYQLVGQQLRTKLLLPRGLNDAMVPNLRAETSQRVQGYISGVSRYQ